jgi:transcriptional regulator with XRE-family HTH domain
VVSKLADLRAARGLTQKELAQRVSASERAVQGWEYGDVPRTIYQEKLAKVLRVPVAELGFNGDTPLV